MSENFPSIFKVNTRAYNRHVNYNNSWTQIQSYFKKHLRICFRRSWLHRWSNLRTKCFKVYIRIIPSWSQKCQRADMWNFRALDLWSTTKVLIPASSLLKDREPNRKTRIQKELLISPLRPLKRLAQTKKISQNVPCLRWKTKLVLNPSKKDNSSDLSLNKLILEYLLLQFLLKNHWKTYE